MLPLAAAFALLAAELPSGCPLRASVAGDQELVEQLIAELDRGGLVRPASANDAECVAVNVHVERRGTALLLSTADANGDAIEREASTPSMAATVIEAWALRQSEGTEGQAIAESGRSYLKRAFSVRPALTVARSFDGQAFLGVSASVSLRSAPIMYSIEAYFAYAFGSFTEDHPSLYDGGLMFAASYPFIYPDVTVAPELALGVGIGAYASGGFTPNFQQAGTRERFGLRLSRVFGDSLQGDLMIYFLLEPDPQTVFVSSTFSTITGIEDGILCAGVSFGLRYSP